MFATRFATLGTFLLVGALACSDGAGPIGGGQVQLSLATRGSVQPFVADTQSVGGDELVFDSIQIVLREIELERENDDACNDLSGDAHDSCEEIQVGPMLLNLPLGPGAMRQFTVAVDTGRFDEIEFEIHKPDDGDPSDQQFVRDHPEFAHTSIRVLGTFNGNPFSYTTDLNVEQELALVPPLEVRENTNINVTLFVDIRRWFLNTSGTGLVDPTQANKGGAFEGLVKDNIKASLKAFEDDDHDGEHD